MSFKVLETQRFFDLEEVELKQTQTFLYEDHFLVPFLFILETILKYFLPSFRLHKLQQKSLQVKFKFKIFFLCLIQQMINFNRSKSRNFTSEMIFAFCQRLLCNYLQTASLFFYVYNLF